MKYLPQLISFLLLRAVIQSMFYIKYNNDFFRIEAVPGDGRCLHHALARDPICNYPDGFYLRQHLKQAFEPSSPWYESLKSLLLALPADGPIRPATERLSNYYSKLSAPTVSASNYATLEDILLYSFLTGNRVICIYPVLESFAVYDTLHILQNLRDWQRPLSPTVTNPLTEQSPIQYVYYHVHTSYYYTTISFNHFSYMTKLPANSPELHNKEIYPGGAPSNCYRHIIANPITNRYRNLPSKSKIRSSKHSHSSSRAMDEAPVLPHPMAATDCTISEFGPDGIQLDPLLCPFSQRSRSPSPASDRKLTGRLGRYEARSSKRAKKTDYLGNIVPPLSDPRNKKRKPNPINNTFLSIVSLKESEKNKLSKKRKVDRIQNTIDNNQVKRARTRSNQLDDFCLSDFHINPDELQKMLKADPIGESLFADLVKNPVKAVLLFYLNSGFFSFQRWKEYCACYANKTMTEEDLVQLNEEILQEALNDEELLALLFDYLRRHELSPESLLSCGACGIRQYERTEAPVVHYEEYFLDDNSSPLRYTQEEVQRLHEFKLTRGNTITIPIDGDGNTKTIEVWKALSVHHDSNNTPWHLHPELVTIDAATGKHSTLLCPICYESIRKEERPRLSIANGVDFGFYQRLGLTLPNLHEQLMLSRARLFFAAIKVYNNRKRQCNFNIQNQLRCHAILFPCEEAAAVAYMSNSKLHSEMGLLDPAYLQQVLSIHCIDDKEDVDDLMKKVFDTNGLLGRSWVLSQWILVLQRLNEYYRDLDVTGDSTSVDKINETLTAVNTNIGTTAEKITDLPTLKFESYIGSDVAQNQTKEEVDRPEVAIDTLSSCDDCCLHSHRNLATKDPIDPNNTPDLERCASTRNTSSSGGSFPMRYAYITNTEDTQAALARRDNRLKAIAELTELDSAELLERFSNGVTQDGCQTAAEQEVASTQHNSDSSFSSDSTDNDSYFICEDKTADPSNQDESTTERTSLKNWNIHSRTDCCGSSSRTTETSSTESATSSPSGTSTLTKPEPRHCTVIENLDFIAATAGEDGTQQCDGCSEVEGAFSEEIISIQSGVVSDASWSQYSESELYYLGFSTKYLHDNCESLFDNFQASAHLHHYPERYHRQYRNKKQTHFQSSQLNLPRSSMSVSLSEASLSQYEPEELYCLGMWEKQLDSDWENLFEQHWESAYDAFPRTHKPGMKSTVPANIDDGLSMDTPSSHSNTDSETHSFQYEDVSIDIAAEETSKRESFPFCEFEEGHDHRKMLATTFPHIFMTGKAYNKCIGRLNHQERFHLLNQFTLVPAQDRRLLGFLFDMLQRMRIMDGVKAYVNSSAASIETVETLFDDTNARMELKTACENPDLPSSKTILQKYLPHLKFASRNVPYGAAEGAKFEWHAIEMNKRYFCANTFLTISPTTIDSPRSVRLAFSTIDNQHFPAVFEPNCPHGTSASDFVDKLRQNAKVQSEGVLKLPDHIIDRCTRANLAMNNPVAYVLENKMLLNDILSTLIGLDPEDMAFYSRSEGQACRKTTYYKARKGIFGHPLYAVGVTEDHSRGTLHWHISLLAGIPPHVLQRFYNLEGICESISKVLDSMYVTALPENIQIGDIVKQVITQKEREWDIPSLAVNEISQPESLLYDSTPEATIRRLYQNSLPTLQQFCSTFKEHAMLIASYKHHHRHLRTCTQGRHGATGCRLDEPTGIAPTTCGKYLAAYYPPPKQGQPLQLPHLKFCLPCNYVQHTSSSDAMGRTSYVVLPASLQKSHTYRLEDVLDSSLPESLVYWETATPRITPTLLPSPATMEKPDLDRISEKLHDILKDLPNFQTGTASNFHNWLLHRATPEQLHHLWSTVLEKLPEANTLVPAFNPTLSWCTGSHNNASLLGALDQAKSALFYLVPYEGKSKFPLHQSLSILNSALGHVEANPSVHPTESGTPPRTTKHFLTRVLNRMHLKMEISDYQMAAALLDLPSVISSDRFSIGNPTALQSLSTFLHLSGELQQAYHNLYERLEQADANHTKLEDALTSIGPIKKLTITDGSTERRMLVPEVSLYLQRSPLLEDLSYYEFLACIGLRKGKPATKQNPDNLKVQKHFHLLPSFAACNNYYHVILQKQMTPLLAGTPPRHPGKAPTKTHAPSGAPLSTYLSWKIRADRFARYYLTLFRPHRLSPLDSSSNHWNKFLQWVQSLQTDSSIISKFRLMILHQHIRGLRTRPICKKMARDYRARNRRLWTEAEIRKQKGIKERKQARNQPLDPHCYQKALEEAMNLLGPDKNKNMLQQLAHENRILRQMDNIYGSTDFSRELSDVIPKQSNPNNSTQTKGVPTTVLGPAITISELQRKFVFMKEWKPDPNNHWETSACWWGKRNNQRRAETICHDLRRKLEREDLDNSQQLHLYDLYANYFLRSNLKRNKETVTKPPQIVLCHGGPGVGKSVLRDCIDAAATACHRFTFKTSFNAINAMEMNGNTTSAALKINTELHPHTIGDFRSDVVIDLRARGFNRESLVIVEEVSNQAPWHLARLNAFCQMVTGAFDEPFGGVFVLLVGDLTQLGPVKATHLTDGVMDLHLDHDLRIPESPSKKKKAIDRPSVLPDATTTTYRYNANHPYVVGTRIFTLARWYELTVQQRSVDDYHTRFVQANYCGNPIHLQTVRRTGYKLLSPADSRKKEWINAPILVGTNRERYSLTHYKAIHIARSNNTVVFRWRTKFHTWKQKPRTSQDEDLAKQDPCFYEYFVQGADGFLTDNIQKSLKLTNATPIKFHSLKLEKATEARIKRLLAIANPGDVITLSEEPLSVNVEITMNNATTDGETRKALAACTILRRTSFTPRQPNHTTYVLPIYPYTCKVASNPTTVRGGQTFMPSKIVLQRRFPIEPAFAITVHKSEGRTMDRVIIALSNTHATGCNYSYSAVHVAFSRVRQRDHIRLLLTGNNELEQWRSLMYLSSLRPNKSIKFFFDGFRRRTLVSPNRDWQHNSWSRTKANTAYRLHLRTAA